MFMIQAFDNLCILWRVCRIYYFCNLAPGFVFFLNKTFFDKLGGVVGQIFVLSGTDNDENKKKRDMLVSQRCKNSNKILFFNKVTNFFSFEISFLVCKFFLFI